MERTPTERHGRWNLSIVPWICRCCVKDDSAYREERLAIQRKFLKECLAPEIEDSWGVVKEEVERVIHEEG